MATAIRTNDRSIITRQRRWAVVTLGATLMVVVGITMLPWFNKQLGHRSGGGRTFFQNYALGADDVILYFAVIVAYVGVATIAFIGPSRIGSWIGIAVAAFTLADASWKMSAWLQIDTEFTLSPGVGFFSVMAGAGVMLVASVMVLANSYAAAPLADD